MREAAAQTAAAVRWTDTATPKAAAAALWAAATAEADDGNIEALTFWKHCIAWRNKQIEIVNPLADKFLQVLELAPVPC